MALASLPFGHGNGEPAFQQLIKDMSNDFPLKSDICVSASFGQSKMTCFISSAGQRTRMSKLSNQPGQIILSSKQPRIIFSDCSNYSQSGQHIWLLELDTYIYIYKWFSISILPGSCFELNSTTVSLSGLMTTHSGIQLYELLWLAYTYTVYMYTNIHT